ncbi:MAG: hypothetical protein QM617_09505, partial [Comamonas sp.]
MSTVLRADASRLPLALRATAARAALLALLAGLGGCAPLAAGRPVPPIAAVDCAGPAGTACLQAFQPRPGGGWLRYAASRQPDARDAGPGGVLPAPPTRALIVVHGHPRDLGPSFEAGWQAAEGAGLAQAGGTLVVAPLFQVAAPAAARCTSPGVPAAQP